jgi:hypothetical protein
MAGKTHIQPVGANEYVDFLANQYLDNGAAVGNVFFVNSVIGSDTLAGYGFSPETPFASIAHALTLCVADNNDKIVVFNNHTETVGGANLAISVAGVTIVGQGVGRQPGTITYSNASYGVTVSAARVSLFNLSFVGTGVAALTAMLTISAADCTVDTCEFEHANATNQAADAIVTTSAANRLWVKNCEFHGTNNAGTNHAISIVGGSDSEIIGCRFQGAYHASQGVVRTVTTDAVNLVIWNNEFQNQTAANTKAIVLTAATTGQISGNLVQILSGTAPFTGAAASWVGQNYYAATIATAGTLI